MPAEPKRPGTVTRGRAKNQPSALSARAAALLSRQLGLGPRFGQLRQAAVQAHQRARRRGSRAPEPYGLDLCPAATAFRLGGPGPEGRAASPSAPRRLLPGWVPLGASAPTARVLACGADARGCWPPPRAVPCAPADDCTRFRVGAGLWAPNALARTEASVI